MSQRLQLSSIDLWSDHERLCKKLLWTALQELGDTPIDANENDLNRLLYRAIIRVSHKAAQDGDYIPAVVPEGRNPPVATDQERAEREFKIPDFYWAYVDPLAIDPDDASKQFVVECKRLTLPLSRYTREYVRSGVSRFINLGHGYGKGMQSGAMVGYLQDIILDNALAGVNGVATNNSIALLAVRHRDGEKGAELGQDVIRPFPVSPFRLTHIWARIGSEPDG